MYSKNMDLDTHKNLYKCLNHKNIKPFLTNKLKITKINKKHSKINL